MNTERFAFITWMKAAGMLLIVYGHTAAWWPGATLPPIATKQLGVAFFVFITGATLAVDTRAPRVMVVRRLFEMLLFATLVAIVLSLIGAASDGNLRESNYLPLMFGANVVLEYFPANPTTWYVGTYIHLILLASLLQRWQPRWRDIALVAAAEIAIRAVLFSVGMIFVPYMLLSNWLTVYALGRMWGRSDRVLMRPPVALMALAGAAVAALVAPPMLHTFPLRLPVTQDALHLVWISASITLLYAATSVSAAQLFSAAVFARRAPLPIRFVADHTLLIFLGHMPVVYALLPVVGAWPEVIRVPVLIVGCILVPGIVSVLIHRSINLQGIRDQLTARLIRTPRHAV